MSKPERKVKPMVPMMAKTMDRPLRIFSPSDMLGTRRPLCRSNLSDMNEASRKMVVRTQPTTNSGLISDAPTSDMYAILWDGSMDAYLLSFVSMTQWRKRPRSVPSQMRPDNIGNIQNETNRIMPKSFSDLFEFYKMR